MDYKILSKIPLNDLSQNNTSLMKNRFLKKALYICDFMKAYLSEKPEF